MKEKDLTVESRSYSSHRPQTHRWGAFARRGAKPRKRIAGGVLAALLVAGLAGGVMGCESMRSSHDDEESSAEATPEPPAAQIKTSAVKKDVPGRVELKSKLLGEGAVELEAPLMLRLDLRGNEGTQVSIGGVEKALRNRRALFEIDLRPHLLKTLQGLGKLSKGRFKNGGAYVQFFMVELPVKLVGTNGEEKADELKISGERMLRWFLETNIKAGKPAKLPGEKEAKPGSQRAVIMPSMARWDSSLIYVGSEDGGFDQVDLYAIEEKKVRTRSCGTYKGATSTKDVTLEMKDSVVTVYDRHTGQQVATNTLSASSQCPTITDSKPSNIVDEQQIKAWLKTILRQ